MNRGRLIGGIACLVVAAVLGILYLTLPADRLMFNMGDENLPWVPAMIAGIVGIVLLSSAGIGRQPARARALRAAVVIDEEKSAQNKRLEAIGWGCFLIMLGGFLLVPGDVIPRGFWSIGVGVIMLGLNATRYAQGIRMSGFTTVVGLLALLGGILQLVGLEEIEGAFLLILLGTFLLVKPWVDKRQLFGKAEEDRPTQA